MSYQHIENLYRAQQILLFRECYALEKIHGTSAHVSWNAGQLALSPGGSDAVTFRALFDRPLLEEKLRLLGHPRVCVYGEAYGGGEQGQTRYGPALRFVAFEVQIGGVWLSVPQAESVVQKLGLEFVPFVRCSTDLAALDAERDAPSEQARRNGVVEPQTREGVVLRPLVELTTNNGKRIVSKHKRPEFCETKTPRPVVDPSAFAVLTDAEAIAEEWVTPRRLEHVLSHLHLDPHAPDLLRSTAAIIAAMVEDVLREAEGEIVDSKPARVAIGRRTSALIHQARGAER